jgi:hypothetical protein
MKVPAGDR